MEEDREDHSATGVKTKALRARDLSIDAGSKREDRISDWQERSGAVRELQDGSTKEGGDEVLQLLRIIELSICKLLLIRLRTS